MREYNIPISTHKIANEVYRRTANAAMLRGDASFVATKDNKDVIESFIEEAKRVFRSALGVYANGRMGYKMPDSWPDRSVEVEELCFLFLLNFTLFKWYELTGTNGEAFRNAASGFADEIKNILNQREKPI
ncbi:MAG: hypothetical protein E7090_03995 [Bacteroidales bacterium]|nr:hypothetical protein [Bacteroidales bacterium]